MSVSVSALCACVGGATKLPFNFSIKQRSRQQSRLALSGRRMQLSAAKRKYKTLSSTAGNQAGADEDDDDAEDADDADGDGDSLKLYDITLRARVA